MDPQALEALKASIQKWEIDLNAESPEQIHILEDAVPLCKVYWSHGCALPHQDCPVWERTGQDLCYGTPFGAANMAREDWSFSPGDDRLKRNWQKCAQEEIDFLRFLLPEGETCP